MPGWRQRGSDGGGALAQIDYNPLRGHYERWSKSVESE